MVQQPRALPLQRVFDTFIFKVADIVSHSCSRRRRSPKRCLCPVARASAHRCATA